MYKYNAEFIDEKYYDGDTVYLKIDLGFHMTTVQAFRLAGINTPELRGAEKSAGQAAKEELCRILKLGPITVESSKSGKYGRWLGEIYVTDLETNEIIHVNKYLLDNGFAKIYNKKG